MYKACTHAKITTLSELMVNLHDGKATVICMDGLPDGDLGPDLMFC